MAKTRKKTKSDDSISNNLKGFFRKGAQFQSAGNIPTGHFVLDFIINKGENPQKVDLSQVKDYDPKATLGLPLGKLVEIYGDEGSGKSSLAYRVAGYAQKMGYGVAWIDSEHSFSEDLAIINGCNVNDLYYSNLIDADNPDNTFYAEDVIDRICTTCASEKENVKVIILDTVANLVCKDVWDAKSEKNFYAIIPRLLSQTLGKVVGYAEKYGVLLIFINQMREKVGVMFGNPETSPGGKALKHNASVRICVKKKGGKDANIYVEDEETGEDRLIGRHSYVYIVKNRLSKPYLGNIEIPIYYEPYFPEIEEIAFDVGRQIKLISVRKGVFSWNDNKVEGRRSFIDHLIKNNLVDDLIKEIKESALENKMILPPELLMYEEKKVYKKCGKTDSKTQKEKE